MYPVEHIWTMLMHKILQNHLLCAFVANLKIDAIYMLYQEGFCDKNFAILKVFAFSYSVLVYLIVDWSNANSTWLIMDEMHRVDHNEETGSPTHFEYGSFFLEDVNHVYSMRIQDLCRRSIFSMNYSLVFQVWKDLGRPLTILDHAYIVNLWPQI